MPRAKSNRQYAAKCEYSRIEYPVSDDDGVTALFIVALVSLFIFIFTFAVTFTFTFTFNSDFMLIVNLLFKLLLFFSDPAGVKITARIPARVKQIFKHEESRNK